MSASSGATHERSLVKEPTEPEGDPSLSAGPTDKPACTLLRVIDSCGCRVSASSGAVIEDSLVKPKELEDVPVSWCGPGDV